MAIRMLRLPSVMDRMGKKHSAIYCEIKQGLLPQGVPAGPRVKVWPEHWIDAVNRALIARATEDEIRALVRVIEEGATPEEIDRLVAKFEVDRRGRVPTAVPAQCTSRAGELKVAA